MFTFNSELRPIQSSIQSYIVFSIEMLAFKGLETVLHILLNTLFSHSKESSLEYFEPAVSHGKDRQGRGRQQQLSFYPYVFNFP